MKTVIMAGGKGTRISSIAKDIPKPMIPINGKPVLECEIECLRKQGFKEIIITVGHLGNVIVDYFGDGSGRSPITGNSFGVQISYFYEKEPLGNAGALFKISNLLTEDFLLLNGDSLFDIDFHRFVDFHFRKKGLATLFTHPNNHPFDSTLIIANSDGSVEQWITKDEKRPEYYHNRVNAGIHLISPLLLNRISDTSKVDLDRQLLKPLAGTGSLFCYDSPEYVKDIGTPERYYLACEDFRKKYVKEKNLSYKQKAIFLDRDGTINKYIGFLQKVDDFELIEGVLEAIRKINLSNYLVIVVTNQPVIARGEVTLEELKTIHNKMETLLGNGGAYVDGIYFCPHHPQKGFRGEKTEYKISCNCRKPRPGMLLRAARDFNIDLEKSWMIGDSKNDILAGKAAGCKTIFIGKEQAEGDKVADSLLDAVNQIIG